jgi:hypothetical protein
VSACQIPFMRSLFQGLKRWDPIFIVSDVAPGDLKTEPVGGWARRRADRRLTPARRAGLMRSMTDDPPDHDHSIPEPLEMLVGRLGELRIMFGEHGAAVMAAVGDDLRRALAARTGGDPAGAVTLIARAMDRLAALADTLDPAEGTMMRALVERFRTALSRGHEGDARSAADAMRERSGTKVVPRPRAKG